MAIVMSLITVLFIAIGVSQDKDYNENRVFCDAVITDVKTDSSVNDAYTTYRHRYYGYYTVNNKTYTNTEILKTETDTAEPDYSIGQTIRISVVKDRPDRPAKGGTTAYVMGAFSFGGVLLIIVLSAVIYKNVAEPPATEEIEPSSERLPDEAKDDSCETEEKLNITNSKIRTYFIVSLIGLFLAIVGFFVKTIWAFNVLLQPFYFGIPGLIAGIAMRKAKTSVRNISDRYEEYDKIQRSIRKTSLKLKGIGLLNSFVYVVGFFVGGSKW